MKRVLAALAGIFSLAVVGFGYGVASADGSSTSCTGSLGPVTINGNVIAGPGCVLSGTTVTGNVTVAPGGMLVAVANSKIYGNVTSLNATTIYIGPAWIGGDVTLDGTTGIEGMALNGIRLEHSTVVGDVTIKKGTAFIEVLYMKVGGDVSVHGNDGSDPSGLYGFVIGVVGSTVGGYVKVFDNDAAGSFYNQVAVTTSTITKDVIVYGNSAAGGSGQNAILIYSNIIKRNLLVYGNVAIGPGSFVDVSGNTVTWIISCRWDTPDATNFQTGPNKARWKDGECAAL